LADGKAKGKDETLIRIDQRIVNQKDPLQMIIEVISPEMIEVNKGISDTAKRDISKETVWQKTSICTMRKRIMKMLT